MDSGLDNLSSIRAVMERHDLMPKKALGQNFLLDGNITAKIARSAGALEGRHVIEIGPGPGGLTRALLQAGAAQVVAVEKDHRCMAALAELADAADGRLQVVEADALAVDVTALAPAPRSIVANLPYNVATPLLIGWLEQVARQRDAVESMTLMFQKEVADRVLAQPGSKAYGRLSVMAQWQCTVRHRFDLPPHVFTPPPKVTSSVIQLLPHREPQVDVPWRDMERVVEKAFGQRRKMLRSALKGMVPDVEAWLHAAGVEPTERAERLSVAQFGALARHLPEAVSR